MGGRQRTLVFGSLLAGFACSPGAQPGDAVRLASSVGERAAPVGASQLHFDVTPSRDGRLRVEAAFDYRGATRFVADEDSAHHFSDVEYLAEGAWRPLSGPAREREAHCNGPCRIRYRFDLDAAAAEFDDLAVAQRVGESWLAPSSTWLLRPRSQRGPFTFSVHEQPRLSFVAGNARNATGDYIGHSVFLAQSTYAGFGGLSVEEFQIGDRSLTVATVNNEVTIDTEQVRTWVQRAAEAVTGYFGQFPVERALVLVVPQQGHRLHGQQLGLGGASVVLRAASEAEPGTYQDDWIATHELVHLAFPSMRRRYLWLNEGLATYVEPLARVVAGQLSEAQAWESLVWGLSKPLQERERHGFEVDGTWAATYWGGALFWLLADLELRRASNNRTGVIDVLRNGVAIGGTTEVVWDPQRYFEAVAPQEHPRLLALYQRLGFTAEQVDLSALYAELGVKQSDGKVELDDTAPLAHVRRALSGGR